MAGKIHQQGSLRNRERPPPPNRPHGSSLRRPMNQSIHTYPAPALWFCLLVEIPSKRHLRKLVWETNGGGGGALARQGVARWQAMKSASAYMLCWHANTLYIHAFVATMSPICSFRQQQTPTPSTSFIRRFAVLCTSSRKADKWMRWMDEEFRRHFGNASETH